MFKYERTDKGHVAVKLGTVVFGVIQNKGEYFAFWPTRRGLTYMERVRLMSLKKSVEYHIIETISHVMPLRSEPLKNSV